MKISYIKPLIALLLTTVTLFAASESDRASNTVVLDKTGVENLRIETTVVEESDFEETIFSLGGIDSIPNKVAAVTSRIPGRIVELAVIPGDQVQLGQLVARVESRQPGDPPPVVALKTSISGLVTDLSVRMGDPVEPDKALLEITDLSEVYAVARVPEHVAGSLKPGAVAHIRVSALPSERFEGELLRFGTSADRASGTIDAIFRLENPSGLLRPGMRAEFSIVLSKRSGVMGVPRTALQGDAAGRFVYVKDFDLPNAFIKTPVVVGEVNDRFAEIQSGLFPADEVVTRGAYSLAFAGAGSVSLKEALDAAHGHEHAADGSELSDKPPTASASEEGVPGTSANTTRWKIACGVLVVLLLLSLLRKKPTPTEAR